MFKKKIFILFLLFVFSGNIFAQGPSQTIVGTLVNGIPQFSVSESTLENAFEDEFIGATIDSVYIENVNNIWNLYGEGTMDGDNVRLSVVLNLINNNFTISTNDTIATKCIMTGCVCYKPCESCQGGTCQKFDKAIENGPGYLGDFGWE